MKGVTYAQVLGQDEFDWDNFLQKGQIRSENLWIKAIHSAFFWGTCPCGQLANSIPRDTFGAPRDEKLQYLGEKFSDAINSRDLKNARRIYYSIHQQSRLLIKKMRNVTGKEKGSR